MRLQHRSCAGHPRDREMDGSFPRRPAPAANNPRGFVHFEDLRGRQAGLVQSRGRNGQAKRLPLDHHAEVSACAERPSARMKASSNFGQGSGKLGETRAAGIFGTRRRLFLARKGPGLLPFHNRGLSHAPMRPRNVRSGKPSGGRHVFADFEGVMTAATVWINGHRLGEYKGGYSPFSFELTPHLNWDGNNVLAVAVDSTERADIPPFGGVIDYLTFGGIYREVALRVVPGTYLENIFAKPKDALTDHPSVEVICLVGSLEKNPEPLTLEAEIRDEEKVIGRAKTEIPSRDASSEPVAHSLQLTGLGKVHLWDLKEPRLYTVVARLRKGSQLFDEDTRRIGFREARFTEEGFKLNGRVVKLRGLNRHQTFPFVGQAMPKRVQRRDALILKKELKCNIVRTSHYPQSRHFLDCCDEIGLLVLEEIPGWQHIGDAAWKELAVDNVGRMIRRDWNHPSIVLWGVRINESRDDHDFYTRTNALAHSLDPTRQTGGIRYFQNSEFLEDVFTMNDFGFALKTPNHPRYLNTEFIGHTFPTKTIDNVARHTEHTLRHARVHNQIASSASYTGGIGWCAFDYDTHREFGSGDRICYHGVCDIFG